VFGNSRNEPSSDSRRSARSRASETLPDGAFRLNPRQRAAVIFAGALLLLQAGGIFAQLVVLTDSNDRIHAQDAKIGDLLPGDRPGPDEEVEIGFREEILHRALEKLPEQERKVVKLRYGINGDNPTPLREAGQMLGMSAEGVRKLEKRALERLAQEREIEGLREAA